MSAVFRGHEICAATGAEGRIEWSEMIFGPVVTDSRAVELGCLFVALIGENFDGHRFLSDAVEKGAAGVVVSDLDKANSLKVPVFKVDNTLTAYQGIARHHRNKFNYPVIAITGSNGKTSTKDMIATVLGKQFRVLKTEANYNNEIGLPKTLLGMEPSHEVTVVEMGMRGLHEISMLASIARPTIGVVTNVGETHIERLGSIANIAAAKGELIEALPEYGVAILNGDDSHVKNMAEITKAQVKTFGIEPHNDVRAMRIQTTADSTLFDCCFDQGEFEVVLPVPGLHNVYNALSAITVALEMGVLPQTIVEGLRQFLPGKMRLNIRQIGPYKIVDDTYNASPLSMAAAIDVLQTFSGHRKVAVIGDMLELGASGEEAHCKVGSHLARIGTELLVALGPLSRYAADAAALEGVAQVFSCDTHAAAGSKLFENIRPGDVVLFKGSRGMRMEEVLRIFEISAGGRS